MIEHQTWIRKKKNLACLLCCAIMVYLVFGLILPAHEKIPYYRKKIELLKQTRNRLETTSLHIRYYRKRQETVRAALSKNKKALEQFREPARLQDWSSQLQHRHQLDLTFQKIEPRVVHSDFIRFRLRQSLSGTYSNQAGYLADLINTCPFLLISECELLNEAPLASNPILTMNLELVFLLPK